MAWVLWIRHRPHAVSNESKSSLIIGSSALVRLNTDIHSIPQDGQAVDVLCTTEFMDYGGQPENCRFDRCDEWLAAEQMPLPSATARRDRSVPALLKLSTPSRLSFSLSCSSTSTTASATARPRQLPHALTLTTTHDSLFTYARFVSCLSRHACLYSLCPVRRCARPACFCSSSRFIHGHSRPRGWRNAYCQAQGPY